MRIGESQKNAPSSAIPTLPKLDEKPERSQAFRYNSECRYRRRDMSKPTEQFMMNSTVGKSLRVSPGASGRAYMMTPESRIAELRGLFDRHGIGYKVDDLAISFNDEPATVLIFFPQGVDIPAVQSIVDYAQ